jgi:hypothetical protein
MFINNQILGIAVALLLSMSSFAVCAELVKDFYIVTFKPPAEGEARMVWPADPSKRGNVPFLASTSGQSKSDLAAQLQLEGEIIGILEATNAIYVNMSAEEANRLEQDPRVLQVTQSLVTTGATRTSYQYAELVKDFYIVTFKPPAEGEARMVWPADPSKRGNVPFLASTSGQSTNDLVAKLQLEGEIVGILEATNAIYVKMSAEEVNRLEQDPRVLRITQSLITTAATQNDPGWALDRLDEATPFLDNSYNYSPYDGSGRTIWVLDTGLSNHPKVLNEFAGRATWLDVYGGDGVDLNGHGTWVAAAAAGNSYGVAKAAHVISVKITLGSSTESATGVESLVIDWLAVNAPAGTIVNWSRGIRDETHNCSGNPSGQIDLALEAAIKAAHDAGIIVVVAAHNDGCNTADFSPTRIPEAFVVGATTKNGIPQGTSIATAYFSGLFATACHFVAPICDEVDSAAPLYQAMRDSDIQLYFKSLVNW